MNRLICQINFIYIYILIYNGNQFYCHECIHDISKNPWKPPNITEFSDKPLLFLSDIPSKPLPFKVIFDYQPSFYKLKYASVIKEEIIEIARKEMELTFMVKRPLRPLRIRKECRGATKRNEQSKLICKHACKKVTSCPPFNVSDKYLAACSAPGSTDKDGPGVDADLIMFVHSSECQERAKASASYCLLDVFTDRPVAGRLNICKAFYEKYFKKGMQSTIKHELIHTMGFSEQLFAMFRTDDGIPRTKRDGTGLPGLGFEYNRLNFNKNTAKRVKYNSPGAKVTRSITNWALTLPKVVKEYATHFDIDPIPVPLENFSPSPSGMNSHFEELALGTELMTPISYTGTDRLSRITLAFLEDTGWYISNYSMAEDFTYGKGFTFDIYSKGCYVSMLNLKSLKRPLYPFCNVVQFYVYNCPKNRDYVSYCSITNNYNKFDEKYNYFDDKNKLSGIDDPSLYRGQDEYAEYCPLSINLQFEDESRPICHNKLMSDLKANGRGVLENYFNTDSICVETSKRFNLKGHGFSYMCGAACLKYACNKKEKHVEIYIQDKNIANCSIAYTEVPFDDGKVDTDIICPSYQEICEKDKIKHKNSTSEPEKDGSNFPSGVRKLATGLQPFLINLFFFHFQYLIFIQFIL